MPGELALLAGVLRSWSRRPSPPAGSRPSGRWWRPPRTDCSSGSRRRGRVDLVAAYAAPLPVTVITALLGLDGVGAARLARHGAAVSSALDGIRGLRHLLALQRASTELLATFERLIEQRRRQPGDGVLLLGYAALPVRTG